MRELKIAIGMVLVGLGLNLILTRKDKEALRRLLS